MENTQLENELELYYLYMLSDGEIAIAETKILEEIRKELSIDINVLREIFNKFNEMTINVDDILDKIINTHEENSEYIVNEDDTRKKLSIIWNLINLGYADRSYSENEKAIVKYFLGKWNISSDVYLEMISIANTIETLEEKKIWITNLEDINALDLNNMYLNLNEEIEKQYENINLLIEEVVYLV